MLLTCCPPFHEGERERSPKNNCCKEGVRNFSLEIRGMRKGSSATTNGSNATTNERQKWKIDTE